MTIAAVSVMWHALPNAACSGLPPMSLDIAAGQLIPRATSMVINVACEPMANKTQLLAYLLHRKPIVAFCDEMKNSDLDDINKECSIFKVKTL
jgi:hypothetical protein